MIAQYLDLTDQYNANNGELVIEVGSYDYCIVQPVDVAADFSSTIDGGGVEGISEGSASTATNFSTVGGIDLNTNTYTTYSSNNNPVRLGVVGRYLKIIGDYPATKMLVMLSKIG